MNESGGPSGGEGPNMTNDSTSPMYVALLSDYPIASLQAIELLKPVHSVLVSSSQVRMKCWSRESRGS